MPSVFDILKSRNPFPESPIPSAHYLEWQWVLPNVSWEEGVLRLQKLFPRDARTERPADWYKRIRNTHWPRKVPPGNGPFYVPEWAVEDEDMAKALEKGGFKKVVAHVCILPPDGEYLIWAMRVARDRTWNVDPIIYRLYIYPKLKRRGRDDLRDYNTKRWGG